MTYDDQDRLNNNEEGMNNQNNQSSQESRTEESGQGQENHQGSVNGSGTYRMTRESLKSSDLYTRPSRNTGNNDYSYYQGSSQRNAGSAAGGSSYYGGSNGNGAGSNSYYGGGNGGNGGSGYYHQPEFHNGGKRRKKKGGFGVTVAKAACLGLVFGLTASVVMFGFSKVSGVSLLSDGNDVTANEEAAHFNVQIVKTSATNVSTTDAEDVSDIVENVMPGIVAVNTTVESTTTDWFGRQYTQESQGAGSGIIISEDNNTLYIMTNYHVIEDASAVTVQFVDETSASATVKGYDEDADVAVLLVDMSQLTEDTKNNIAVMVMGDSDDLKAGSSAIAIGNALGYGQSVTTGVISAVNREVALTDKTMTLLQTSAAINPGNSGGALLNGRGEVIGMNTVKYSDTSVEGMGYAIPINDALETAKGIIDGTIVPKTDETTAYLGITGGTLDEDTASLYNAPAGVYVSSVSSGSAAERAGLTGGCIITAFNGQELSTMEELQEAIAACAPGDNVTITAQFPDRNGEYTERTVTTIMGSKADMEQSGQINQ